MPPKRALAYPRIGILGNPSDGYGGRVLSLTFSNFSAGVEISTEGPVVGDLFQRLEEGAAEGTDVVVDMAPGTDRADVVRLAARVGKVQVLDPRPVLAALEVPESVDVSTLST